MRIDFERSGGFGGMKVHGSIDTEKLPTEQANALDSLINAAGFFELPGKAGTPSNHPDEFCYKITIDRGDKKHTLEISDQAVPTALRPLLMRLTALARSGGRPKR